MNVNERQHFVKRYLQAMDCEILAEDDGYVHTALSVEADKDVTGRQYYWMFVERTGAEPKTLDLQLFFDEEKAEQVTNGQDIQGELIQFGCWRLHQIFQSAQKRGKCIRLYEEVSDSTNTQALVPWLCLNYTLSFVTDQKKDLFYPLGINLVNGEIVSGFAELLDSYPLTPRIPDYHFTLTPIFSLQSAADRVEQYLEQFLNGIDNSWAEEANKRLDEERDLIQSFFDGHESEEEAQATLQTRLEEVERYRPHINVSPVNAGLVYLQTHPLQKMGTET